MHCDVGDIIVFVCHVTFQDQEIKALFGFMVLMSYGLTSLNGFSLSPDLARPPDQRVE